MGTQNFGSFPTLESLARDGDAQGVRAILNREPAMYARDDANFGFQTACETGNVEVAQLLAPVCSIIAVSRGLRKAAWKPSHACVMVALGRLDAEGGLEKFDMALGLRDAPCESSEGLAVCKELLARAASEESAWALRELIARRLWVRAQHLLAAGASWEGVPTANMISGDMALRHWLMERGSSQPSPRAYWEALALAESERPQSPARTQSSLGLAMAERRELKDQMEKADFAEVAAWAGAGALDSARAAPARKGPGPRL